MLTEMITGSSVLAHFFSNFWLP